MTSGVSNTDLKRSFEQSQLEEKDKTKAREEEPPTKRARASDPSIGTIPADLQVAIRELYIPAGLKVTKDPRRESESEEYGACRLGLENRNVVFRVAKTTPTKIGQFVTLWKRPQSTTTALDINDNVDYVVISSSNATSQGQFIFDREALLREGIMAKAGKKGKMAFRVYPPWSKPEAPQAIKTQKWQLRYFVNHTQSNQQAYALVRKLFKFI